MSKLDSEPRAWNNVDDFYAGRSVFVTGASGFLGKVLIEKLLHDCPKVKNIYVLLRTKGSVPAQARLTHLLESRAFDRIRRIQPSLLKKVKVIRGDTTFDGLGISASDVELLKNDVSVVVHSAATIRFDEPLKRATRINVTATKRVLELALQFRDLKAFVHVSTAYCNQTKLDIKESVYPELLTPEKLMSLSNDLNDEMLESLTPHLFGDRPSSYHYTKAMAENLVESYADRVPVGIVRPSIITASLNDPMPGWIDNYNGPSGYLVTAGAGILRAMLVDGEKICDAIPVDIVANTIITTAWYVSNQRQARRRRSDEAKPKELTKLAEPFVVNCISGQINPITWEEIRSLSHPWLVKYPPTQIFRYPGPTFVSNKTLHKLLVGIEHDLPTYVIDLLFKVLGHSPMLGPIYQKVHRTTMALEFFTKNEWIYRTENFQALGESLSSEDKRRFVVDVKKIDWPKYMENYVLGVRHFLLNEDPNSIDAAKTKLDLLYYGTQATKVSVAGISAYVFYKIISWRRNVRN
jgi:fatty acyl-CoA reductase